MSDRLRVLERVEVELYGLEKKIEALRDEIQSNICYPLDAIITELLSDIIQSLRNTRMRLFEKRVDFKHMMEVRV